MEWRDRIFTPPSVDDPHYLNFSPYEPKVHEPVRQAMMTDAKKLEQEEEEVFHNFNAIQQNIIINHQIITFRILSTMKVIYFYVSGTQ